MDRRSDILDSHAVPSCTTLDIWQCRANLPTTCDIARNYDARIAPGRFVLGLANHLLEVSGIASCDGG